MRTDSLASSKVCRAPRQTPTLAWALALATLAAAPGARAQTAEEIAGRRELLNRAQSAQQAGNHAEALAFAERAQSLSATPSVRLFIAEQNFILDRVAEALGGAELALREATALPTLANRESIMARARVLIAQASPRVGRLVVRVREDLPDASVRVNGRPLARAFWNVASVVSPGALVVEASAPGRQSERHELRVERGAVASVEVQLLLADHDLLAPETARTEPTTPSANPLRWSQSPLGLTLASVGVVAFAVGLGLGLAADATFRSLDADQTRCPGLADCDARADRVEQFGIAGTATMLSAGALFALGTTLLIVMVRPAPQMAPGAVSSPRAPIITARPNGLAVVF